MISTSLALAGIHDRCTKAPPKSGQAIINEYSRKVLQPEMDPAALSELLAMEKEHRSDDPRYMDLLTEHYYTKHMLRMPPEQWPGGLIAFIKDVDAGSF